MKYLIRYLGMYFKVSTLLLLVLFIGLNKKHLRVNYLPLNIVSNYENTIGILMILLFCKVDYRVFERNAGMYLVSRFPLRLDYDFQHSTERPILITDQPYTFIFFLTGNKIYH